ncbi:MAG: copper amine oxidase N-terminal domain-containing protein [Anaeromicrobium sp.]|jgi:hypothetical protein|uniref:stalk domain-containing protein n=1 Tax=Anaeromicrobium sp. TaxID=1929132 RepID=UPI0025DABBBF|nr:stalk domain-containing protein [Anaeromicrobium sp.]MCT4593739.1 copper amine oxidase N-terminal domain-containing protein [Anaeromicrobium sp.]
MKKKLTITLIICLILSTVVGVSATYTKKINAWFYNIKVNYNGKNIAFNSAPFIYNGYVYVPVNDLANGMGYSYRWHNDSKTMNIYAPTSSTDITALQAELDRKNMEITNLKFQLSQQNLYKSISNNPSSTSNGSLDDVRRMLEEDFDSHENDGNTLRFKDFKVSKYSNEILVKMYGDFDKSYTKWEDRDDDDFDDFIEDLCEEVIKHIKKDVVVKVYDDDNDQIDKYTYDYNDERLYEEDDDDDIDDKLNSVENDLEDDYDDYKVGSETLEFTKFSLKQKSDDHIECKIYAKFDRTSDYWKNRDEEDFRDFVDKVCDDITDEVDEDVDVLVYDEDNDKMAEYEYDEDDNDLDKIYEY